jgi:uncharacterized protein YjiS (DUF1127 family)
MKKRFVNNLFVRFMRYCVMWSEHREAIKILNKLSDRELKDIGISRSDIDRMVWLDIDKANRGKNNNEK